MILSFLATRAGFLPKQLNIRYIQDYNVAADQSKCMDKLGDTLDKNSQTLPGYWRENKLQLIRINEYRIEV
ncbi:hypothetical protein MCW_00396 [Cardidatus Bartonella washoeensis 085-0475]|uniref:Uncharacterized protein n=1 Tax=Cardidatus Bartonella washoeensis 085-0475 TaxID=1094564 RepID=J1JQ45_9HYPH|nr:hypothetical protein MCW_00396 [Bartonella washoeensis 085-0475]